MFMTMTSCHKFSFFKFMLLLKFNCVFYFLPPHPTGAAENINL